MASLIRAVCELRDSTALRAATLSFSLFRIVMLIGLPIQAPKFFLDAALPTQMMTSLPELLILDPQWGGPLLVYYLCHSGASAYFHHTTDSLLASICQGFGTQALCLCAFLAFRLSWKLPCTLGGLHLEDQPEATEQPAGQQTKTQQQEHEQEHTQTKTQSPTEKRQSQPDKELQQGSQQQEEKEQKHVDKVEQVSSGLAAQAPHLKPHRAPQYAPLSSANLAAATAAAAAAAAAAAKAGYNNDATHKTQFQGGKPQGLKISQQVLAADKGRVSESECASLSRSHTAASSVTLDSISSISRSSSSSQVSLRSDGLSLKASSAMSLASPHAQAVLADALKARAEKRQHYASQMHKLHASGSNSATQYVQSACRFAVKVQGPSLPASVPNGAVHQLQQRLSRYQRLMDAEAPAVRAGCLVISYGALLQQHSLQDMSKEADAVGWAWAEEHGLLSPEDSRLAVQACRQSSWCSSHALPGQPFPPEHSIIVHEPFIEANPSKLLEQESFCTFDLTLIAPASFELRGWQGAADAPEDLPDKDGSLCLLASMDGHFVQTSVEQRSQGSLGERQVQVQVSLPAGMFDAVDNTPRLKVLVLELWAAGNLVECYSAITVPSLYAGALEEMHSWVDQTSSSKEESAAFMGDLVVWMHYLANNATLTSADEEFQQQKDQLAAVGLDLLGHSLQHGMPTLAGLLLNGLVSSAFSTSPSDHPNPEVPATGQSDAPQGIAATPVPDITLAEQSPQRFVQLGGETSSEEVKFRAWANAHISRLARMWCRLWLLNVSVGALRAWTEGQSPLLELSTWGVKFLGYTMGGMFIQPGCSTTEPILVAVTIARAAYSAMIGTGLVPLSFTLSLVFKYRMEALVEVFMMSVMERVRLSWAVPLRALLVISFTLMYQRIGLSWPLLQAVIVNLCALGITAAAELRDRRLYRSERLRIKQQAFADEGVSQHAASPGKQKLC